jgi:hypothetical protein
MAKENNKKVVRPIYEIAREIHSDWGAKTYFGAKPYISAMLSLSSVDDKYMFDDARTIIRYFLSNAVSWRGEVARRIKAELKEMVK